MRGRRVGQHGDQVVGLRQQRVQVHVGRAERSLGLGRKARTVVVQHLHAETMRAAAGDALADAAHAEDAQRAAMDVCAEHGLERPLLPLAFAQPALGFGDPARGRHQQGETEIGGGFGQDVRRVAGEDAGCAERIDIQVVVADADIGDHLQLRGVGHLGRTDALVEGDDRAVDAGQLFGDLVGRPGGDRIGAAQLHAIAQRRDGRVDQRLAHPHGRPRVSHRSARECAG